MMGAAVLEPEVNTFTDQAWEYKYMPKLRGAETGAFVPAQNSTGEWYYNDLNAAYGEYLNDLTYQMGVFRMKGSAWMACQGAWAHCVIVLWEGLSLNV